ncbi:DUF2182 domain-containing protein [Nocardioides gansuensis]|nr:DUF2182 domain-containing protein [Nocardioides gansuensis]
MSLLQATLLAGRLSGSVRSTSTRVVLGCAAAAWVALSVPRPGGGQGAGEMGVAHVHHPHTVPPVAAEVVDPWSLAWIGSWLLMVVAMMWPLTIPSVGAITRSSFRGWRMRLGVVCLATVTILWLAVGLAGAMFARTLSVPPGSVWWQLAFVCLALVAFRSSWRSRVLEGCLRLPALAPGGRRGVVTATRAGMLTWRRCALLCGPVMLAMAIGHSLVLMVFASLAAWWEAWHPRAWRDPVPVLLIAGAGAWIAVAALLDGRIGHA